MNLYGVVTGTNDYSLNVAFPPGFKLCVGDTITINPVNANTGASTLSVGGLNPLPLTLNGVALTSGQLEAGKDRQCTFKGSSFACDNAGGGGGGYTPSGTADQVLGGDGVARNLSAADIPALYAFKAQVTTGTTLTSSLVKLPLNAAVINTVGTVSSSVITITTAGWYIPGCALISSTNANASLELNVNGSRENFTVGTPGNGGFTLRSQPIYLAAGDAVYLAGFAVTGSPTIDSATNAFLRHFYLIWIGN